MLLVGLTGGIGSGKSTVARMLADRGAVVLDADEFARRAVQKGTPGHARVQESFGAPVLTAGGEVTRPLMLRRRVPSRIPTPLRFNVAEAVVIAGAMRLLMRCQRNDAQNTTSNWPRLMRNGRPPDVPR